MTAAEQPSHSESERVRISRRTALRQIASACVAAPFALRVPAIHVRRKPVLRVLGTHVTLQKGIRQRAAEELDIDLRFSPGGSAAVLQQASTRPSSFDVFEQWSNTIPLLWQAGAIKAIDTDRIEHWSRINSLSKTGRLAPEDAIGKGDAPHLLLHVQPDGQLGEAPTGKASFLPYVHNVDSFAYSNAVPEGRPYETESWSWLLDDQWRGKVALVNEPTIGLFDAALALQARGVMRFGNLGALTREELDELFEHLLEYKRKGHFYGLWNSVPESVAFMEREGVVIESMFSPGVADLESRGLEVKYAAPKEGYRAWQGVMCLSSQLDEETEEAAYKYLNWWLSGWPGAVMARQGYYLSVPELIREHMKPAEWDFWYRGELASEPLPGPDGKPAIAAGQRRRGGSYAKRFSNVAVWNTVMKTYEYSLLGWFNFLTA